MRSRVLGAATFFLSLQLLAAASAHAQGPQPPTPPKARPPFLGVAHNVITWFHHVTGTGRTAIGSCLYRRRCLTAPAQLTKTRELPLSLTNNPLSAPPSDRVIAAAEPNKMSPPPQLSQTKRRLLS